MRAQILNHYCLRALFNKAANNSYKIFVAWTAFIFLFNVATFAQPKFKIFDTKSGLSNINVTCIVQDQTGYLWVGTRNGLNRFDGHTFKVFKYSSHNQNSISSNIISSLAVDKFNRIWMGHEAGLTCYDPSTHKFTRYRLPANLQVFITSFISIDKYDRIWVGVPGNGLVILNPETGAIENRIDLTPLINKNYSQLDIKRRNTINGMIEDPSGLVWLASHDGLYVYDRKLDSVRVVEDIPGKYRSDYFIEILGDEEEGFWLGSYQRGIFHYSPKRKLFNVYQPTWKQDDSNKAPTGVSTINDIAWKGEKEIWFTTSEYGKAIGVYNIQTGAFSFPRVSDNFGSGIYPYCTDVFVDPDEVVWVASSRGLIQINDKRSSDFKPIFFSRFGMSFTAIVEDTILKKRFMGTNHGQGLVVSNSSDRELNELRSFKGKANPSSSGYEYIHQLLNTSGDSLWVVSRDNIRLFDKVNEKWIELPQLKRLQAHTGSVSPSFYRMIKTSNGDYWIATFRNGAYKLSGTDLSIVNFKWNATEENSICSNFLVDILEDRFGRIWFASPDAGISILDPEVNTFKRLNKNLNDGSQFLTTNAMDIDRDGNVWVATREIGLIKINVVSEDSLNIITFDNKLLSSPSTELEIDGAGRVWFRSSGIHMLDNRTMNIKSFERILHQEYALIKSNNQVLVNGYDESSNTGYGLIDEEDLLPDTTSSRLVINSVEVFGKEIYPGRANNDRISLPYDQNSIAIDFAAINFLHNEKIRYSYKLEGLKSNEWTIPSGNRSTEFANLDGGDYIFKLRMYNQEGVGSKEKSLLHIHIETPFWETKWFYALLSAIGIGIIAGIYFYQINRIRDRENTKKRISQLQLKALHTQMRPHFIFNCLSAINGHIMKFETVKASEFLSQFSKLMRGILENSTESWITLEQEIETLRLYLSMEALRFEDKFSYHIEVEEGVHPSTILIPSMIIQPFVENAIGHGILNKEHGTGMISIKFLKGDGNLKCIVEDNGIGREQSGQIKQRSKLSRKSLGLQITSERLQLLQGSVAPDIEDLKNEFGVPTGTRIIVMLMTKKIEKNVA